MRYSLGIDTGGTYTDAVLFHDVDGVVAKAKSPTTRHDLSIGIAGAVDVVMAGAGIAAGEVALVSLSTTLATNALVEGRGGRVALMFIGFGDDDHARAGLTEAMQGDPVFRIAGGHDSQGNAIAPLDITAIERAAIAIAPTVSGFAVTSQFATRNPEHEIAARNLLRTVTTLPITCGHELSAKLNGPRRALTSVLNARLIGLVTGLIASAEQIMASHGIDAPLMVVRGDGSLMNATMAKARPIETILSGPAASVVGAAHLTGAADAIVSDIGGTTTDVAVIEAGVPHIDESGASVGGHRTMVEAVAMTTVGLGGDSEVVVGDRLIERQVTIGPRRVVPIAMMAVDHPRIVHEALDRQLLNDSAGEHDARFVLPLADAGATEAGLEPGEVELLVRVRRGPSAMGAVVRTQADGRRLNRLVARGLAMLSTFTPTDASHVLGDAVRFDRSAADKAAQLMARRRTLFGKPVAADGEAFARWVVDVLQRRSAEAVLDAALAIDGFDAGSTSRHALLASSLDGRSGVVEIAARLTMPLVALGASAALYYPAVAAMLRTEGVVPADADVANAIGAVVGRVRVHAEVYISQPQRGRFHVHHPAATADVSDLDEAVEWAESLARADAARRALDTGAEHPQITVVRQLNTATVEGEDYLVDATVTATASGRPRLGR